MNLLYGQLELDANLWGQRTFKSTDKKSIPTRNIRVHSDLNHERWNMAKVTYMLESERIRFNTSLTVNGKQVHCISFDKKAVMELINGNKNSDLFGNLQLMLCNELSKIWGWEPVYYIDNSVNACDFLNNSGKLSMNNEADGFRLPTLNDVKKFLDYAPSGFFPAIEKKEYLLGDDEYNYFTIDNSHGSDSYILLYWVE